MNWYFCAVRPELSNERRWAVAKYVPEREIVNGLESVGETKAPVERLRVVAVSLVFGSVPSLVVLKVTELVAEDKVTCMGFS